MDIIPAQARPIHPNINKHSPLPFIHQIPAAHPPGLHNHRHLTPADLPRHRPAPGHARPPIRAPAAGGYRRRGQSPGDESMDPAASSHWSGLARRHRQLVDQPVRILLPSSRATCNSRRAGPAPDPLRSSDVWQRSASTRRSASGAARRPAFRLASTLSTASALDDAGADNSARRRRRQMAPTPVGAGQRRCKSAAATSCFTSPFTAPSLRRPRTPRSNATRRTPASRRPSAISASDWPSRQWLAAGLAPPISA